LRDIKAICGRSIFYVRNLVLRNRRFLKDLEKAPGNETSSAINVLAEKCNSQSYLEIGLHHGLTFEAVNISSKVGVDPKPLFCRLRLPNECRIFKATSDVFFSKNVEKFDFIFLDGLHEFGQTWRDFVNAASCLTERGFILIDDTVPCDRYSAIPNQFISYQERELSGLPQNGSWHGDVFKIICILSDYFENELAWFTFFDLSNPKTLVFKKVNQSFESIIQKDIDFKKYSSITYDEIFSHERPSIFHPSSLDDIIKIIR